MIGDAFVFDGVAHPFNFAGKNAFGSPGQMFANHLYAFHATLTPDGETHLSSEEFLKEWTPSDIRQMVYDESDTDMLVAMPLPLTDLFRDGLSPWETCTELAARDPDRTVFWGSVNPLEGRRALDLMERLLADRSWLVGDTMTIADIALLPYTRLAHEGGFDLSARSSLSAWIARCEDELQLQPLQH